MVKKKAVQQQILLDDNPHWYKDAIIYELHVRAFADSDGDGIGDFRGLKERLDYLQDLGVTAIWLLPFYPSPLRDDGYDIADYTSVNPIYGNLKDFKDFLAEAHKRGLRVITELVLNHTSDQHPWFQRARKSPPGSNYRNFYVWNETPNKYRDARIIFKDFETSNWSWDPVARAYFWHRFYSHQPDLNFENPMVHKALLQVVDFWFNLGVDGLRLDAVPYLYEEENSSCENLPATHDFLKKLRAHVDKKFKNRMLLAEANQWPEDAVAYFGDDDECQMAFHFPLMPRLFMSLSMGDRFPVIDILEQTPVIPENSQWAIFLRNHDELTLEMVTDEERDFMYRMYAFDPQARVNLGIRRRLAPLLGNDRRQVELLNGLLFSITGTPVIYYGDEIGMGDNIYLGDRNGVRTPLQWSADRNAGFSKANPQKLYLPIILDPEYHYETINIEAQQTNPNSLLWWMKRLISLRKRNAALRLGGIEFLHPENRRVLVFIRTHNEQNVLVVANMSRQVEYVELDLARYIGYTPVELFGQRSFPEIGDLPYFLTLTPYSFFWFDLVPGEKLANREAYPDDRISVIEYQGSLEQLLHSRQKSKLEESIPAFLKKSRWFGSKNRVIQGTNILDITEIPASKNKKYFFTFVEVDYGEKSKELYSIPMGFAQGAQADELINTGIRSVIARMEYRGEGKGLIFDAMTDTGFCRLLFGLIAGKKRNPGDSGELVGTQGRVFRNMRNPDKKNTEPHIMRGEQSNTSVVFEDTFILKIFRRIEPGTNPDLEIGRFLTDRAGYSNTPPVAGSLEYTRPRNENMTLGILQGFMPSIQDTWTYVVDVLQRYTDTILVSNRDELDKISEPTGHILDHVGQEPPREISEIIGPFFESARLLGQRTAELHIALASDPLDPEFGHESFTPLYQRSLFQSMRNLTDSVFSQLRKGTGKLPEDTQELARKVLNRRSSIQGYFKKLTDGSKIEAVRIRTHGDFHLGQVLFTGKDFYIIDFEGEPSRSLSERKLKRSPLRDVSGMLRSFHYAAYSSIADSSMRAEDLPFLQTMLKNWYFWVSVSYLDGYLKMARGEPFIPESDDELRFLLDLYLYEKAVYEVGYEFNSRPDWLKIPLLGIAEILDSIEGDQAT